MHTHTHTHHRSRYEKEQERARAKRSVHLGEAANLIGQDASRLDLFLRESEPVGPVDVARDI